MIGQIILITYIVLAGTVGAWWFTSNSVYKKEITLLDVVGNILPSLLFIWLFYPLHLLERIKIKKLSSTKNKEMKNGK
jgi:hypothetical protein